MRKLISKIVMRLFVKLGYRGTTARLLYQGISSDLGNRNLTWKERCWAWRHGFTASRMHTYHINARNYFWHIPEFDYLRLHPINGRFSRWIDDKLTMRYLLSAYSDWLPSYYFMLGNDQVTRLMDCPTDITADVVGLLQLLKKQGTLAVKRLAGSLGEGFYRLDCRQGGYLVNLEPVTSSEINDLLAYLQDYLVTEYVHAHPLLQEIYAPTPNTLRVQMTRYMDRVAITGCFMRFGTKQSGTRETPLAGALIAYVNRTDGQVSDAYALTSAGLSSLTHHPDTHKAFDFILPHWRMISNKLTEITDYIPQLGYMGFDLVITQDGFKIIEINSLTSASVLPYYYPLLRDEINRQFFGALFQKDPKRFKRPLKHLDIISEKETQADSHKTGH